MVEIDAGVYDGDAAVWAQSDLTIRAVGGVAHVRAGSGLAEGKGIWVIKGRGVTVESAELSGARSPRRNGSGIRGEGVGLTVREAPESSLTISSTAIGGLCGSGRAAMSRGGRKSQMTPSRRRRSISSAL